MCGRRTRPFSGRAFREHLDQRGRPSNPFHLSSSIFILHPERKVSRQAGDRFALYCARPTRAFRGRALREQEGQPVARYIFFRTSFHSFATFAFRGASLLAGSGTITASRRRCRNASAKAFVRPTPILSVVHPAACSSSSFAPNASGLDGSTTMCPTGNFCSLSHCLACAFT